LDAALGVILIFQKHRFDIINNHSWLQQSIVNKISLEKQRCIALLHSPSELTKARQHWRNFSSVTKQIKRTTQKILRWQEFSTSIKN
jgi:hypothetical protein